jgi:carbon starvation protein CstA
LADFFQFSQKPIINRLLIAGPLFTVAFGVLIYSMKDKDSFAVVWRYFAWANQTLSIFTLWAVTVYLVKEKRRYIITLVPALFITMVCTTFILIAPKEGFGLNSTLSYSIASVVTMGALVWFVLWKRK